jgi:hypothetical protein
MRKSAWFGWTATLAAGAVLACGTSDHGSGSGANDGGSGQFSGPSCMAGRLPILQGNAACDTCAQSTCQGVRQCAYSACSDYFNCFCACAKNDNSCYQRCLPQQTRSCLSCIASIRVCGLQTCAAQCILGGGDGGFTFPEGGFPDVGIPSFEGGFPFFDAGGSPSGTCASLAACCAKVPASEQAVCNAIASAGDPQVCQVALATEQDAGTCP